LQRFVVVAVVIVVELTSSVVALVTMGKEEADSSTHSTSGAKQVKNAKQEVLTASVSETLGFAFQSGSGTKFLFTIGTIGAIGNGLVYPILAYLFSHAFNKISSAATNGLGQVRTLAFTFMIVGAYALVMATFQTACFEVVAYRASQNFRLQWFRALLRQDAAFYDVYDIGGLASTVGSNANKYRRGVGRKFGEGLQFLTTGVGGIAYAFYSNWQTALVVLCALPLVSLAAFSVVRINQTRGVRTAEAYKGAGSVAYSTVSAIKTVLSLNAIPKMIELYTDATAKAYKDSTTVLWQQGMAFGTFVILLATYAVSVSLPKLALRFQAL
jgi:ATP-binding cassette subfamily B (MDR/TAP) protein 1